MKKTQTFQAVRAHFLPSNLKKEEKKKSDNRASKYQANSLISKYL